jgi:hypothetical protein
MPVILATQEAEIRRIKAQNHPGQIVQETHLKIPSQKRAGGVVRSVGPEFKPSSQKKKKKSNGREYFRRMKAAVSDASERLCSVRTL